MRPGDITQSGRNYSIMPLMLMNMTMSVSGQVTGGRQCNKMCMFELDPVLCVSGGWGV